MISVFVFKSFQRKGVRICRFPAKQAAVEGTIGAGLPSFTPTLMPNTPFSTNVGIAARDKPGTSR